MNTCKYGDWLTDKEDPASIPANKLARDIPVSATTIKTHRAKLCGCFPVLEAVAPGPTDKGLSGLPKPALDYDENGGTLVSKPRPAADEFPTASDLFAEYDMDPDVWEIVSTGKSKRQANSGEWYESCRATFKPRKSKALEGLTAAQIEEIVSRVPRAQVFPRLDSGGASINPFGDTQAGKVDRDGGTPELIERATRFLHAASEEYASRSHALPTAVLPWLGDCIEGVTSQNGRLVTRQDINVPEQVMLVQRLMLLAVDLFAPYAERVVIPVVPGNHDETGRQFSNQGTDSWAIHAAASVREVVQRSAELANVEFLFPERDKLTATLDVANTRISCLHGHQFRGGLAGAEKLLSGWALSREPEGAADLLLCAHLHHLHVKDVGSGQSIIQIPAMDGGSGWFADRTGQNVPAGMVSLEVKDGRWSNLRRYS